MTSIEIKEGATESAPFILANKELATVFAPPTAENLQVFIKGGHAKQGDVGYIYAPDKVSFNTENDYSVHVFDTDIFEGVSVIQFSLSLPAKEDLKFYIYLKAF